MINVEGKLKAFELAWVEEMYTADGFKLFKHSKQSSVDCFNVTV
jgi:hypothetical protein